MTQIEQLLGEYAPLLSHHCSGISKELLHLPGPDFIDRVYAKTDRSPAVLRNLATLFRQGRLAQTGYLNILPVDQGIEHSAGASFAMNPAYFDPSAIAQLALEGGCSALAATFGMLGAIARQYAHRIPLILKVNHNEFLSYPNTPDQVLFTNVNKAFDMGCVGVGATIYWGSDESRRQLQEISDLFSTAHDLGLFTVLWCYVRNPAFIKDGIDYQTAADLTGQANHLGVTIEADIIKQKLPETNEGYKALQFGKTSNLVYSNLTSANPIDMTRYQVANCYMGRAGLINSGGPSGKNDLQQAALTAVINKRAGGTGLICGRKAFQKPLKEGIQILNTIQDIYLDKNITIA